jgi:hypothetical protein
MTKLSKRLNRAKYIDWNRYLWVCTFLVAATPVAIIWGLWTRATGVDPSDQLVGFLNTVIDAWDEYIEIIEQAAKRNGEENHRF